ncbi:MAG: hypothetical protein R3A44_36020 [Caldilineaceae bacterium]
MSNQISIEHYTNVIGYALKETFESVHGVYLDKGTSLFETLADISAAEASIPVGGKCATIAAQVEHTRFYLDVLEQYMLGQNPGKVDWAEIWNTVSAIDEAEWAAIQARLRASYQRVTASINGIETWRTEDEVGGPIAIIAHTAYHLGEIRQALCTIKS